MSALQLFSSALLPLITAAGLVTLAPSAFADGSEPRYTQTVLDAMLAPTPVDEFAFPSMGDLELEAPLTAHLSLWSESTDELELREALRFSPDALPMERVGPQPPFIDFGHLEAGGFAGLVDYSAKFKANASWVAGANVRVPVPGMPLGEWGIWGEAFLGYVSRDLPFYYNNQAGTWFGAAVGGDYTFLRREAFYLRAELGMMYAYWNGVNSLDNGVGGLLGVQAGFYWIKSFNRAVFTITPQLSFDGKSWIAFVTLGFQTNF